MPKQIVFVDLFYILFGCLPIFVHVYLLVCLYISVKWNKFVPSFIPVQQVHSVNVLRALYRDTRLADDVFPFISAGMQVAVLGCASKFWAVSFYCFDAFSKDHCLLTVIQVLHNAFYLDIWHPPTPS